MSTEGHAKAMAIGQVAQGARDGNAARPVAAAPDPARNRAKAREHNLPARPGPAASLPVPGRPGRAARRAGVQADEPSARTAHFVFLLVDDFSHLAFSCAIEPLRIANRVAGQPLYRWSLASPNGVSAVCSNRTVTLVDRGLEPLRHVDRLLVIAGERVTQATTPAILSFLRRERAQGTPIGAICSGACLLASAGFLDGQRAAVHWEYHDFFAEVFPEVRLVRGVFVADQKVITAAGGTAAADLMLHLIAAEHGADLAIAVADQMVYNAVREATAEQRISLQSRHGMRNPRLKRAVDLAQENIEEAVSPAWIAARVGLSTRQLERLFKRYLDTSPKRFIIEARLSRARNLLVQTEHSVHEIAVACGFATPSNFSKAFRAHFGVSPLTHRATLR